MELRRTAADVAALLASDADADAGGGGYGGYESAAAEMLLAVEAEAGLRYSTVELRGHCEEVIAQIDAVVEPDSLEAGAAGNAVEAGVTAEAEVAFFAEAEARFAGRVRPQVVRAELDKLRKCERELRGAVRRGFAALLEADEARGSGSGGGSRARSRRPAAVHDYRNKALWLRLPAAAAKANAALSSTNDDGEGGSADAGADTLRPAMDRNGQRAADRYSTEAVDEARATYLHAAHNAELAVEAALRALAADLEPSTDAIAAACTLAKVAKALLLHTAEALRRGWALPAVAAEGELSLRRLWPYWMPRPSAVYTGSTSTDDTVSNDFVTDGMVLLTGPNMAGKSTLIRAACTAALLGNCGLFAPSEEGSAVPHVDALFMRTVCTDSPIEKQSAFAVEMLDMHAILRDSSHRTLVFVDEIGRGTEPGAGTALSAAFLEELDGRGCIGVFATHLHGVLEMPLALPNTRLCAMETAVDEEHGGTRRSALLCGSQLQLFVMTDLMTCIT